MNATPFHVGQIVQGTRLGGGPNARRLVVMVEEASDVAVVGLWAYASTFTEGGTYQDSYRGRVVLDPATVVVIGREGARRG